MNFDLPVAEKDRTQFYILVGGAVVGFGALGWAAAQGWVPEGDLHAHEESHTLGEDLGTFAAINVGLILAGSMVKQAFEDYGVKNVLLASVAIPAAGLLIGALRS